MEFNEFKESLPDILGEDYYSDPEKTKPTKAFDDINDYNMLAKSYLSTKRMVGKKDAEHAEVIKHMVKVPGENATDDEVKNFRSAMGVPESPDGYDLPLPENISDLDKQGFQAVAEAIKPIVHAEGISPSKLTKVWSKVVEVLTAQNAEIDRKGVELLEADTKALQEKYKERYDPFIKAGNDSIAKFNTKDNPVGENFKSLLDTFGILNAPATREFLFALSKLVLPGGSNLSMGVNGDEAVSSSTGLSYKYDSKGKPI